MKGKKSKKILITVAVLMLIGIVQSFGKTEENVEVNEAPKVEAEKENKPAEPASLEDKVKSAIIEVVGENNNMDKPSIASLDVNDNFGTEAEGDKLIIAKINANDNLSKNFIRTGILMDSTDIFKSLFELDDVSEVTINWEFPLVDQYGNEEMGTLITVTLDKEIANKINWNNFNKDNLAAIAKEYREHPALSK